MTVNLHLFSSPGENDIRYIVDASRPYLERKAEPLVAYLPLASLYAERWQEYTGRAFHGLAQVEMIDTERMTQTEMEAILRLATIAYIPGGNTFLLSHRLHISGILPYLRKKVQAGLPVLAFSAGSILCGPNILTSKDMNTVGTSHLDGLSVTPFNFLVHYAQDPHGQSVHDAWLADYHFFHDNPVIMLSDGASVRVEGRKAWLERGEAWILRKDQEKELIKTGRLIAENDGRV
jgi:peptidase E